MKCGNLCFNRKDKLEMLVWKMLIQNFSERLACFFIATGKKKYQCLVSLPPALFASSSLPKTLCPSSRLLHLLGPLSFLNFCSSILDKLLPLVQCFLTQLHISIIRGAFKRDWCLAQVENTAFVCGACPRLFCAHRSLSGIVKYLASPAAQISREAPLIIFTCSLFGHGRLT